MSVSTCNDNCEVCNRLKPRLEWVKCENGAVPKDAVLAGKDSGGEALYVGRAIHQGDLTPGKVKPSHNGLRLGWRGGEYVHRQYEVLVSNSVEWKWCEDRNIPPQALVAGYKINGEKLYVGRTRHDVLNHVCTPGKVSADDGCLYIAYRMEETAFEKYEILIMSDQMFDSIDR